MIPDVKKALHEPTDKRVFILSQAMRDGFTVDEIHDLTKIDKWFLYKLENIINTERELEKINKLEDLCPCLLRKAKEQGFSDFQIAKLVLGTEESSAHPNESNLAVRKYRLSKGITPVVKQIDTLAGEFPAQTNYLYLTYNGTENDVKYLHDHRSIVVLGSGAYRIGSSVEFDWCSVNALMTVKKEGWRSVMINYNPETVSTDYDMCDRLYSTSSHLSA